MIYFCPVCGYRNLPHPPSDYQICSSCGTEFGYDDCAVSHEALRQQWIARGAVWFSDALSAPSGWNPFVQLLQAGLATQFVGADAGMTKITYELCGHELPKGISVITGSTSALTVAQAA